MKSLGITKFFNSNYMHELSLVISENMNLYLDKKDINKIKMQYGVEILLLNISKLFIILLISLILGLLLETLIVIISFNLARLKAFGVHANNSLNCFLVSILLFIPGVYFINTIKVNNIMIAILFMVLIIIITLYAPADTKKRPIIGKNKRYKLKMQALAIMIILMIVTLSIPYKNIKILIAFGAFIEAATVLPITYRILKKGRNNYEYYEKDIKK